MQNVDIEGISVIMPTFNQASYIRRAIKSLCEQTYGQWELIIVNDGSTDSTEEFIADFFSSSLRVRYIKNESNQGLVK
jgi:glycosyltransferase involved in cell wall biosynthesis